MVAKKYIDFSKSSNSGVAGSVSKPISKIVGGSGGGGGSRSLTNITNFNQPVAPRQPSAEELKASALTKEASKLDVEKRVLEASVKDFESKQAALARVEQNIRRGTFSNPSDLALLGVNQANAQYNINRLKQQFGVQGSQTKSVSSAITSFNQKVGNYNKEVGALPTSLQPSVSSSFSYAYSPVKPGNLVIDGRVVTPKPLPTGTLSASTVPLGGTPTRAAREKFGAVESFLFQAQRGVETGLEMFKPGAQRIEKTIFETTMFGLQVPEKIFGKPSEDTRLVFPAPRFGLFDLDYLTVKQKPLMTVEETQRGIAGGVVFAAPFVVGGGVGVALKTTAVLASDYPLGKMAEFALGGLLGAGETVAGRFAKPAGTAIFGKSYSYAPAAYSLVQKGAGVAYTGLAFSDIGAAAKLGEAQTISSATEAAGSFAVFGAGLKTGKFATERLTNPFLIMGARGRVVKEFGVSSEEVKAFNQAFKVSTGQDYLTKEYSTKFLSAIAKEPLAQKATLRALQKTSGDIERIIGSSVLLPQTGLKTPPRKVFGDIDLLAMDLPGAKRVAGSLKSELSKAGFGKDVTVSEPTLTKSGMKIHVGFKGKEFVNISVGSELLFQQLVPVERMFSLPTRFEPSSIVRTPSGIPLLERSAQIRVKAFSGREKDLLDVLGATKDIFGKPSAKVSFGESKLRFNAFEQMGLKKYGVVSQDYGKLLSSKYPVLREDSYGFLKQPSYGFLSKQGYDYFVPSKAGGYGVSAKQGYAGFPEASLYVGVSKKDSYVAFPKAGSYVQPPRATPYPYPKPVKAEPYPYMKPPRAEPYPYVRPPGKTGYGFVPNGGDDYYWREPPPPKTPPTFFTLPKQSGFGVGARVPAFDVFVKNEPHAKKAYSLVGKQLPYKDARERGFMIADNTISQSVRLKRRGFTNKQAMSATDLSYKFRPRIKNKKYTGNPLLFIEKRNYAIDTIGEKQKLKVSAFLARERKGLNAFVFPSFSNKRRNRLSRKKSNSFFL